MRLCWVLFIMYSKYQVKCCERCLQASPFCIQQQFSYSRRPLWNGGVIRGNGDNKIYRSPFLGISFKKPFSLKWHNMLSSSAVKLNCIVVKFDAVALSFFHCHFPRFITSTYVTLPLPYSTQVTAQHLPYSTHLIIVNEYFFLIKNRTFYLLNNFRTPFPPWI